MNSVISKGLICLKNKYNIEFSISEIEYILYEDGSFEYIFTPYYKVIDLLDNDLFQGIPGIELNLKKDKYIRENIIPTFISERVPSDNRENLNELLQSSGLDYLDPIEYLIRSKCKYSGDDLYVKKYKEIERIHAEDILGKSNSLGTIKIILDNLASGNEILINNNLVANERSLFQILEFIYSKGYDQSKERQKEGIKVAKEKCVYKGRKPKEIDELVLLEQLELLNKKTVSLSCVLNTLNISRATFYRLKKEYQK